MGAAAQARGFRDRILEQLLSLRAAGGLEFAAVAGPGDVWRWHFRAAGFPIAVDLDPTVLELRVYHGNDLVATGAVTEALMRALLGRSPVPAGYGGGASADEALAALRAIVADWKRRNARLFVEAPQVARHPDGWNNA